MRRISTGVTFVVSVFAVFLLSASPSSQGRQAGRFDIEDIGVRQAVAREILVKFQEPPHPLQIGQLAVDADAEGLQPVGRTGIIRVRSRSRSTAALVAALRNRRDLAFVEPNYVVHAFSDPGDTYFPLLWGLKNIGQPVNGGAAGTAGADIHAAAAWDLTVGSASNVVAVVDTGINYMHDDLVQNMWSAPSSFTVTIRGVPITCDAGTHGFNAIARTCDPMDDHNHGTHVAGTIGAAGNNGIGVAGVNWVTSLMGLKFLDSAGTGNIADAIDAIDFALQTKQIFSASSGANIRVLSNSWGGGDFSQALLDAINAANDDNVLFVAAAGNNGISNDLHPQYPASYAAPNVIAVAATTNTDTRASFSNYGAKTVHLGAPGVNILSTIRNGHYGFSNGTSMAAPHVSGAAVLTLSHCALNTADLKTVLVDSVDPVPAMATTTISGGRLNVHKAMLSCSEPPGTPANLTAMAGDRQIKLTWSAAANAATYRIKRSDAPGGPYTTIASNIKATQYINTNLTNGTTYYYVVSAANILGESGDSNEASATPKLPADMDVSAFTVPSTAIAGSTMSVSVTTKNAGTGSADPSTTRFFLSTNAVFEPTDGVLQGAQAVPALAPGMMLTSSVTVGIPSDLQAGAYYLIAKADADDVMLESSESNNTYARGFSVGPDLVVSKLTVPSTAAPGATVTATFTVQNKGTTGAHASTVEFFWSTNISLDAGDPSLGTTGVGSLVPNGTQSGQIALQIPPDLTLGNYYIFATSDSANVVAEAKESNNETRASIDIGGDLEVSNLVAPAVLGIGMPFTATDTTKNAGGTTVGQSVTHFYLSPNAGLSADDTFLGSRTVAGLGAGEASTADTTLTIPDGTPAGSYYLFAKADGPNAVTETQEGNNTDIKSAKVGPDFTVSISSVTSPVHAGATTAVKDTVTNKGANNAGPSEVRYYFSTNTVVDAADTLLAETRAVGLLVPNGTSTATTPVTIPAGIAPGLYYVIAQADGAGSVAESSETNNTYARQIRVD